MEKELRRNRIVLIVLAVALALVIAVPLTLGGLANSAFSGVKVVYDAAPLECDGTEVGLWSTEPGFQRHAVNGQEHVRCTLDFWVVNEGRRSVEIPNVGARGSDFLITLVHVNPNGSGEAYRPSLDAEADVMDIVGLGPLEPGDKVLYSIVFETAEGLALSSECSIIGLNVPMVTLTAFGRERVVQPPAEQHIDFVIGDLEECAEEWWDGED